MIAGLDDDTAVALILAVTTFGLGFFLGQLSGWLDRRKADRIARDAVKQDRLAQQWGREEDE